MKKSGSEKFIKGGTRKPKRRKGNAPARTSRSGNGKVIR